MSEPRLEDMSDYDTLSGEKRKVVFTVIIAGIIMSVIYVLVSGYFGNVKDSIKVEDSIKYMPLK